MAPKRRSDDEVLKAIAQAESGGDPNAIGKSGEIGKYQFMPNTIKQLGGDAVTLKGNSDAQDALAKKHIASLRSLYGDDDNKVIAAWNAGQGGVDSAIKKGGADWQKHLPKGTNKFGASYDTGAYVSRVNTFFPQEDVQQPQQQSQPSQPQSPQSPGSLSVVGGPDQTLAQEYHARKQANLINWMNQGNAPEAPKPEAPKSEPPQEPKSGGLINAIGSGVKTLASAPTQFGKMYADALYPANPQDRGPAQGQIAGQDNAADRGIAENVVGFLGRAVGAGVEHMGKSFEGAKELVTPSAEESARRSALPIGQQLLELATGVGQAIEATPVGGVMGAAGQAAKEISLAVPPQDDESIKTQIEQLKAIPLDVLQVAGVGAAVSRDEHVKMLEEALMMPVDKRQEKAAATAEQAGQLVAGVLPLPFFLGLFSQAKKAFGLTESVKAARAAVIAKAAESAATAPTPAAPAAAVKPTTQAAAAPAAAPKPPLSLSDVREGMAAERTPGVKVGPSAPGSIPENMMTLEKMGAWTPAQKLAAIEQDPAARQVINDIVEENIVIAPGSARVQGTRSREQLRRENVRGFEDTELRSNMPERTAAEPMAEAQTVEAPAAAPAAEAGKPKPEVVNDIIEDFTFDGKSKRATMLPNDNMVVARDAQGNDLGFLWYTREPGGGFTIRKLEVKPEHQRKGIASYLEDKVAEFEGPYRGATDQTPEGAAYRSARGGKPKLEPAPEEMYRAMRDAMHGDPDLTKQALESRGYKMPELGEQEMKAVAEAMDIAEDAPPAAKNGAVDAVRDVATDLGVIPEMVTEALPAVTKVMKSLKAGDLKSVKELVAEALKNGDNPLSALRAAQAGGGEAGRINAGTLFLLSRAVLGGVAGSMVGDDPEDRVRNVLLGAGLGAAASPRIAKAIIENSMKPEVRETLMNALTLHGESGALRFPARGVGKKPSPNTDRMGVSPQAKQVVRGVNERLEKLGELTRSEVQTHEMTKTAARHSKYAKVENVLSLDADKLSPEELAAATLAARNATDAVAEGVIEAGARVRLNPGNVDVENELMTQMALLAKASKQTTNLKTALARAENALVIETDITAASKFDLGQFAAEVEEFKGALTDQGKVTPSQLAEMVGKLADKAAATKLATVASKWPPALWNIYYGLNLLSSPLTHMRNFIGNTGALGMAVLDRAGGELLGPAFRALGAKETVAIGETYHLLSGIMDSMADAFRSATPRGGSAFGAGVKSYETGLSKFKGGNKYTEALNESVAQQALMNEQGGLPMIIQAMSTLGEKNMRVMSGTDEFFKVLSFEGEMRALARRRTQHLSGDARREAYESLLSDPTTDMLHGAEDFARENTFTKSFKGRDPRASIGGKLVGGDNSGALMGLGASIEGVAQHPIAKVLFTPFFRTPVRIGEFSSAHTPVLNLLAPQFWSDITSGGAKAQLAMSKVAVGTGIMTMAGWYASHGYITGAPPSDPGLREKLQKTGWQEYSFYVPDWVPGGGKYVSYANVEPLSTLLGTVATFMQVAPDLDEMAVQDFFSAGALAIGKNAFRQQWWQGISDASDAIQAISKEGNANGFVRWLARKSSLAMPGGAAFRYVQNATDPYQHEPEIAEWKKLADIFAQNAPGWGGRNALELAGYKPRPAALNGLTGEEVPNENQWIGLVAPFRVSSRKDDIVIDKVVELGGAGLPRNLIPKYLAGSAPASMFKLEGQGGQAEEARLIKEGVMLDNEQYHRLSVLLTREVKDYDGNTMHAAMVAAINDPDFEDEKGGPDGGQARVIRKIYHDFLAEASDRLREEYPEIDYAILMRKHEREGRRMPKSMDWLLNEGRQELERDAAERGVR